MGSWMAPSLRPSNETPRERARLGFADDTYPLATPPLPAGGIMRQEFEMSEEDMETLLEASKPTPVMYLSGGIPMHSSPQENANQAWKTLGEKLGFAHMTVQPMQGKGNRFFTAEES